MIVKLTEADRERADICARAQIARGVAIGAKDRFGHATIADGTVGFLGEIVFHRFLGCHEWECELDGIGKPDVHGWEVRTVGPDVPYLYVKAKDNDPTDRRIVGVSIVAGRDADDVIVPYAGGIVLGWLTAGEIRRLGKLKDPGRRGAPAWFVQDLRHLHRTFDANDVPARR